MSISFKSLLSLSLVALFGTTLSCDATAAQSRDQARTNRQIEACLAEIGRRADYREAAKVVHWIASLEQKNLLELRIVIDTTVVLNAADQTREYRASCVTDTLGGIVDFRFLTAQPNPESEGQDARS